MEIIIQYTDDTSIHIDGFGKSTAVGALMDVLDGTYDKPDHADVECVTISFAPSAVADDAVVHEAEGETTEEKVETPEPHEEEVS